ncbi:MAG TPA: ATP-binding protein [Thermoanaerobaculia bacterium]|nr:ATP-binding protein [Thermoanaerobaculia bacterium]
MSGRPLRVLLLEDSPADAELVVAELRRAGFEPQWERVQSEEECVARLRADLDVVISDFSMPGFDAVRAIELVQEHVPHVPLIIVSGTVGEETAVAAMRRGASDYLLKDRLARLGMAVTRALEQRDAELARRDAETAFLQAQKMEAIGRLAGGIAHDFNNLLTGIMGYAELLLQRLDEDSLRSDAEQILRTAEHGAGLTRQLLAFGRKQAMRLEILDLNQVLQGVQGLLRRLVSAEVALDLALAAEPIRVHADRTQLEQVVLNLAVNAGDAMPHGGRLRLSTRRRRLDDGAVATQLSLEPGVYGILEVADTGVGMDEATQARMFEPFFTTKEPGKGTGLGLATVFGIVKQCGGQIAVETSPGEGATFTIFLPSDEAARHDL